MADGTEQDPFSQPPTISTGIPHSKETVRRVFDHTDLGDVYPPEDPEAIRQAIPDTPAPTPAELALGMPVPYENLRRLPEARQSHRGFWYVLGGAGVGLAAVGVIAATHGEEDDPTLAPQEAAAETSPITTAISAAPSDPVIISALPTNPVGAETAPPVPELPYVPANFGIINIANAVDEGEDVFTGTRTNGEEITVPALKTLDDIDRFGLDSLSQFAAILNLGDRSSTELLDGYSKNTALQQQVLDLHDPYLVDAVEAITLPTKPNFQLVLYDEAGNEASFIPSPEPDWIMLDPSAGPIYAQLADTPIWQSLEGITADWARFELVQFELKVVENPNGTAEIIDHRFRILLVD
ncbi:MAG: hypothetical protein M3Q14_04775 [bacterium]|nr:hypothetical protein [bacterium]